MHICTMSPFMCCTACCCVHIQINKLKAMGILAGDEVLHTMNGREYLTQARVKEEVQQALKQVRSGHA